MGETGQVRDVAPEEPVPGRGTVLTNLREEIRGRLEVGLVVRIVFVTGVREDVAGRSNAQGAPLWPSSEKQARRAVAVAERDGAAPDL